MLRSRSLRAALLSIAALLLAACGGGTPTRAEFVAKVRDTLGDDLIAAMHERGLSERDTDELIDTFLECQYDALRSDPEILRRAYDRPGDINVIPEIDTRTLDCVQEMTTAMSEAAGPAPSTTLPPDDQTALPSDPPPTTLPLPPSDADAPPTTLPLPPADATGDVGEASFDTIAPAGEG